MRTILDSELLTIREAQKLLNVNKCEILDMIQTGQLEAIESGSQIRIEGRIIKSMIACSSEKINYKNYFENDFVECDASDYEMEMISDWT